MGNRVAVKIAELGLKKGFIAKQVGIAPGTLSKIIQGGYPTLPVAIKLARVLETTVEELWGYLVD